MVSTAELYQKFLSHPQVVTDSRKIVPGAIFYALKGDSFDGNRFALKAIEEGCAWAVVDDPTLFGHPRCLPVEDVLTSLQNLALFHRKQLSIPVIGITGTNGKTTTKELITAVLSQRYKVVATIGNLNNHIGVPLTLLSITPNTQIAIVEMGANHPGEIAALCAMALPTYGLITNIGKAHLEGFGSFDGVIRTKNELYEFLREHGGQVFVNKNDSLLMQLLDGFPGKITQYATATSHVSGILCTGQIRAAHPALEVELHIEDESVPAQTQLAGSYNLDNILAAACVGAFWNVSGAQIASALEQYTPKNNRSQWCRTEKNQLLLDYYNANPSSMHASLQNFISLQPLAGMVVLGDMFELGADSPTEHLAIIQILIEHSELEALVVGPYFFEAARKYSQIKAFVSIEDLKNYFSGQVVQNRVILLKGSRGMHLEQLMPFL